MGRKRNRPVIKDNHHLIPRARKNEYNVDVPKNIYHGIQRKTHEDIHRLFGVSTPREIMETYMKYYAKVLDKKTRDDLREILNREDRDFYCNEVLK